MHDAPQAALSTLGLGIPDPRAAVRCAASVGTRGVALDASAKGVRPRELTRSERRGIASALRRAELECAGLDLFIPAEHLSDPAHAPRAVEALEHALAMSAELASLVGGASRALVSTALPEDLDAALARSLSEHADRVGAVLADHTPGAAARSDTLVVGVDPARVLMSGGSPAKAGATARAHRLSDAGGGERVPVGSEGGSLEVLAYAGACAVAGARWVVIDPRGLRDPIEGARAALRAWGSAAF